MRTLRADVLLSSVLALGLLALEPAMPAFADPLPDGRMAERARLVGLEIGAAVDMVIGAERLELAAREFTSATMENSLKWRSLSPAAGIYDFTSADAAVQWAENAGLRVRGHTLFWDRLNGRPRWLDDELAAADDPATRLTELMRDHAETVISRYAGRLAQWDVVNEPLSLLGRNLDPGNLYFQLLGESYLDIAFHAARSADPQAKLFVNETLVELLPAKFNGLMALVERLLARGVPIDGVGLQGHFFLAPPNRALLQTQLEHIAELGLLVELTEVDLPLRIFAGAADPLAAQAAAYAEIFSACLAVPACTGVTVWGVDDGVTWLDGFFPQGAPNRPLLFDVSRSQKPAYAAIVAVLEASILDVPVDVKPGDPLAHLNPASRGVVPVAILGSEELDVRDIDPESLQFGPSGAPIAHRRGPHLEEVDGDHRPNALSHHRMPETGIAFGDTEACLSGRTFDGRAFLGCDEIQTVPACGLGFEIALLVPGCMALRRTRLFYLAAGIGNTSCLSATSDK